ncbi:MAG TPA: glycine cleavage T C-terminal barrel domain-containing protein [Bryobacteraceae bacterium]|jgi:aminomethyltransferase|nr:glycine cleavage T C-terminal barrel domain-containing protein [Bryobacteraceae bacterium]
MNGYQALRESAAWIDLSDRGKILVTGEDRARLLHALSTNDIQNLGPGETVYAFFLNEKGRVIGDAYISNFGEGLWVDTEPELRESLFSHLERYIIADDVTLTDISHQYALIAIEGPNARAMQVSQQPVTNASTTGQPAIRAFVPLAEREAYLARLAQLGIPQASKEESRVVRIENGVPRYGDDISDRYLAAETQVAHAVHPNKGCYLGQEIVERVRSQGQVHRLLTPLRISGTDVPAPGTRLHSDGREVGEITSAVYSPAFAEVVALGYVRREVLDRGVPITLAGAEAPVTVRPAHS